MKKFSRFLTELVLILVLITTPAFAENLTDLSTSTTEELVALQNDIYTEILSRMHFENSEIFSGKYVVGDNITAGKYVITCTNVFGDYLRIYTYSPDTKTGTQIDIVVGETAFVDLTDNMTVEIENGSGILSPYSPIWAVK